jgi:hypothetical protein
MNTFCENDAKIYIEPARAEQISAAIFLLFHFEYRIFHFHQTKLIKNIIIIKQLKTVNLFFI